MTPNMNDPQPEGHMASCIERRKFLATLLGGTAAAWPLAARAQQAAMPVVGMLSAEWPNLFNDRLRAFHDGLRETGYVEGRNLAIEYRWAEGQNDRLPALVAELVRHQVTVIVSTSTPAVLAARTATTTIPIVFFIAVDPVQLGLVTSLSRPGGNLTGVVTLNVEVAAKRLQLLHELVPTVTIVALLVNPTSTALAETTAKELLDLWSDVILANSTPIAVAVRDTTRTTPTVFVKVSDPVTAGVVQNLERPSGNLTGFTNLEPSIANKWLCRSKYHASRISRNPPLRRARSSSSAPRRLVHSPIFTAVKSTVALPGGRALTAPRTGRWLRRALRCPRLSAVRKPRPYRRYRYFQRARDCAPVAGPLQRQLYSAAPTR